MARVLRPGGRLLIGELRKWSHWSLIRRVRGWFGARPRRDTHFYAGSELRSSPGRRWRPGGCDQRKHLLPAPGRRGCWRLRIRGWGGAR